MSDVWAYHAGLDRYVEVPESALQQMGMSGWVRQDPPPPAPDEDDLEALAARAAELGVKVDGRWGAERLAAEIAAAEQAAQAEPDPSPAPAEAPEE